MPKIIENLPQRLMEEARRQVLEAGYGSLTIRSVAKGCGVGIGTVYNYFPSKDAMVASFMLEDWTVCIQAITVCSETAEDPEPVLRAIYENLLAFSDRHQTIFQDEAASAGFSGSFGQYHSLLRSQLAAPLHKFCPDSFTADFIAESLLVWTVAGKSFDSLHSLIKKLF